MHDPPNLAPGSDIPRMRPETISEDCADLAPDLAKLADQIMSRPEVPEPDRDQEDRGLRARAWLDLAGRLGNRYANCTLASFLVDTEAKAAGINQLRRYAETMPVEVPAGNGIMLYGPSGSGKDHALVAMARIATLRYGFQVAWESGLTLFATMRDRIGADQSEGALVTRLRAPRILMLSDPVPPRGALTEFQAGLLLRIVDDRYRALRPTWVSVNVRDRAEADERLSPQIVERLIDGALVVHFNWPSFRKRGAERKEG